MADTDEFPYNVVVVLKPKIEAVAGIDVVVERPLRPGDPNHIASLVPVEWTPIDWSSGQMDPAISQYMLQIEYMTKNTNGEEARREQNATAKTLRVMLYRDPTLAASLGQLSEGSGGLTERASRWGIRQQRFASNEYASDMVYLSVIDFWLETDTV